MNVSPASGTRGLRAAPAGTACSRRSCRAAAPARAPASRDGTADRTACGRSVAMKRAAPSRGSARTCPAAAIRRLLGHEVGDVLQHDLRLGQDVASGPVELERRHVALGVDQAIVLAGREALGVDIDAHELERSLGFAQCDVRRQRARARGVIEPHTIQISIACAMRTIPRAHGMQRFRA